MSGRASISRRSPTRAEVLSAIHDGMASGARDAREMIASMVPDAALKLLDFIPDMSPSFSRPEHLAPLAAAWETMADGEVREVWHCPPRHGKTELILHGIARDLKRRPRLRFGYATYSADLAESKSRRVQRLAIALGVELITTSADEWETKEGGGLIARGVGGGWTGRGLDRLIIDDPIKDRAEAESKAHRKRLADWFGDAGMTRLEPGGSVILNMTRWTPSDLAGDLISEGWTYRRLPAWCDDTDDKSQAGRILGEVLWPERWPNALLVERSRNEYTKASLYQGLPRPRGSALFEGATYYDPRALPERGYREAAGLDLAYTAKTSADWSVLVILREHHGLIYVVDVIRRQVAAPVFRSIIAATQAARRCKIRIYHGGGGERGVIDLLESAGGIALEAEAATADKFVRAQPAAEAWNAGRILLPSEAPWLDDFLVEVAGFTGSGQETDDQVDALAAGYDALVEAAGVRIPISDTPAARDARETREYRRVLRGW